MHPNFLMGFLPSARVSAHRRSSSAAVKSISGTQAFLPAGPSFAKPLGAPATKMNCVAKATIRQARPSDARELAALCALLWPDGSVDEHLCEVEGKIAAGRSGTLPVVLIVAEDANGSLAGFIEVGLRSHADGCDTARPVGYIEGWYVGEPQRGMGVGRKLMHAAEDWSREHGCTEIASDALTDNLLSQQAHSSLGFEIVDRCVHYKKALVNMSEGMK
jgi:aminoglycoside 6'-N-acetyltransferase I